MIRLVNETYYTGGASSATITIPATTSGNLLLVLACGYGPTQKWVSPNFVKANVSGTLSEVSFWSLQGGSLWDWGTFSTNGAFADIAYIVSAGGDTSISFNSNAIVDGMWIVEFAGATSIIDSFTKTGSTTAVPVFGSALSGSGNADLCIQLLTLSATSITSITNWRLDSNLIDGNGPAYRLGGSGTQSAPQFNVTGANADSYTCVAVAFKATNPGTPPTIKLVSETVYSNPSNLGNDTFSLSQRAQPGNVLVLVSKTHSQGTSWMHDTGHGSLPYNYVQTDVDPFTSMHQVPFYSLFDPPEFQGPKTGTGNYTGLFENWYWACYDPGAGLGGGSIACVDIMYFVTNGANSISYICSSNPKIWVYELSGFSGLPIVDDFRMMGANGSNPATVISPALNGIGSGDVLLTLACTLSKSYSSISAPWILDSNIQDGNAPAIILNGSGVQSQINYGVGTDQFTAASVAFIDVGTVFCGGMASQVVGNPLI